jgi:hypothetical protein
MFHDPACAATAVVKKASKNLSSQEDCRMSVADDVAAEIARTLAGPARDGNAEVEGSANLVNFVTDPPFRQINLTYSHGHDLVQPGILVRAGLEIWRHAEIVVGRGHRFAPQDPRQCVAGDVPS